MKIKSLSGNVGAEISDLQLAAVTDASFKDLQQALWTHLVLVFRNQRLAIDDHIAFGRRFGELHTHPAFPGVDGHAEVLPISNRGKDKTITEVWHSDVSCDTRPPSISILRAIELPACGGDTLWASQYAALDRLSPAMRDLVAPLSAVHKNFDMEAVHPVARTHPETQRQALYVNHGFTSHFEGMTREESQPLINYLVSVGSSLDLTMRHSWQPGDVVMWDNRCVMHFAIHDYGDARRDMQRVTVRGERPC